MQKRTLLGLLALVAAMGASWAMFGPGESHPVTATTPPATPAQVAQSPDPAPDHAPQAPAEPRPVSPADRSARPDGPAAATAPVDLAPYLQSTLQAGSQAPAVEALQAEFARKHGYPVGAAGRYDGPTEAAVRQFQAHMGLAVDGIVGPATWSALASHFVELEHEGPGFYRYWVAETDSSWGTETTVATVRAVAAQWAQRGHGVRIGINDISLPHGGPFPPHSSHRSGRDVDFRLVRSDGAEAGVAYTDPAYSRTLTQALVDLLWATGEVQTILFNDPQVRGVSPWAGHDDHLHVRFRR